MGTWGKDLFADDLACDVRDHYRQLLEDGVEDGAATRLTHEKFRAYLEEPEGIALVALAVTQSKIGRLEPDIRDRALAIIDAGADLEVWESENPKLLAKRRAVLDKARAQLTGPQPARRRLRPPKRCLPAWPRETSSRFRCPGASPCCGWCACARIGSEKRRCSRSWTSLAPRCRRATRSSASAPKRRGRSPTRTLTRLTCGSSPSSPTASTGSVPVSRRCR